MKLRSSAGVLCAFNHGAISPAQGTGVSIEARKMARLCVALRTRFASPGTHVTERWSRQMVAIPAFEGRDRIPRANWLAGLALGVSSVFDGETLPQRIRWQSHGG